MSADKIKARFEAYVNGQIIPSVPPGYRGALIGTLEKACRGKENRKLVLKYLTGKTSSKELTPGEWYALSKFVNAITDAAGHWVSAHGPDFDRMIGAIMTEIARQPGQMEMVLDES